MVRPAPQPQRQFTPRPAPSRTQPNAAPASRPTFKPATRSGSSATPSAPRALPRQQPAIRPMPQVAKKVAPLDSTRFSRVPTRPGATSRPLQTAQPSLARRPVGFVRPDGRPGRLTLSRPADRTGGVLAKAARLDPVARQKWGNWGKWSGTARSGTLDAAFISPNFRRSVNWSYHPSCWGSNPWWTASACHRNWYHGHWHYGWNPHWYRRCYSSWYPYWYPGYYVRSYPISWGLACWGLGSLVYDTGYYTYSNPYVPEPYSYESTVINYTEPMAVTAREYTSGDEIASNLAASRSADALERSRTAFRDEDYLTALSAVDEAISYQPGDAALHEYRALVLFALGKYRDAAGVLHPLLASGPGWDRATMTGLYGSEDSYLAQLGKLEQYVAATPDQPAPRFLLGYHYLVGGELDRAAAEFDEVARLRPEDSISRQLRDLARSSVKSDTEGSIPPPPAAGDDLAVEAPTTTQLVGTWRSDRAENGIVTLSLRADAGFTWSFTKEGASPTDFTGTWEINDRGLLVLSSENAQMVGSVKFSPEEKMTFILAGGPEGDPGLTFDRVP
jgi:tetratricopeptide (TPR) repeat protein